MLHMAHKLMEQINKAKYVENIASFTGLGAEGILKGHGCTGTNKLNNL